MKTKHALAMVTIAGGLAILSGAALPADKYTLKIPGNGKPFPDGAKTAKIQYVPKKSSEAPFPVAIPGTLNDVAFMVKDSERFADSGGWGYGLFLYDDKTDAYRREGNGAKCGAACHTIAKSN